MAKRSPERDRAFEIWVASKGEILLKDIAGQLNVSENQIRKWKCQDKWDDKYIVTLPKKKNGNGNKSGNGNKDEDAAITVKKLSPKKEKREIKNLELDEAKLTEKQRLFCLYFIKNRNATQAALNAGYSPNTAYVIGSENLRKPQIAKEINRLRQRTSEELFIDAMDILEAYRNIAFANMSDVVVFGQRQQQVIGLYGPVYQTTGKDEEGKEIKVPVMETVNYVDLKESVLIDGSIITEVSQNSKGIKIKLADKMKALEKLEQYFDLLPDTHKRKVEEERLKIEQEKVSLLKLKAGDEEPENVDDGWLEALEGKVNEVWADEEI